MNMIVCKFFWLLLFLLTALIVKNSHISAAINFIFLKTRPRANLKGSQYQIWTSVKRAEKQLSSMTNLSAFLQIGFSNFELKLFQRP